MLRTPKADEVMAIYETRKNRVSGAHTQVLDDRPNGGKYILRCVTHDQSFPRNVRLATEAESHHSEDWCPQCTDTRPVEVQVTEARARMTVTLDSSPEEIEAFMDAYKEEQRVNALPSAEAILEAIGNATSKKTCLERVAAL
jgi:hypothetical protein